MVARTRLIVMLYVHCFSWFVVIFSRKEYCEGRGDQMCISKQSVAETSMMCSYRSNQYRCQNHSLKKKLGCETACILLVKSISKEKRKLRLPVLIFTVWYGNFRAPSSCSTVPSGKVLPGKRYSRMTPIKPTYTLDNIMNKISMGNLLISGMSNSDQRMG